VSPVMLHMQRIASLTWLPSTASCRMDTWVDICGRLIDVRPI